MLRDPSGRTRHKTRTLSRWIFHLHLWLGILATGVILLVSITGILLNHKRPLGLMPDVAHTPGGPFEEALPLAEIGRAHV